MLSCCKRIRRQCSPVFFILSLIVLLLFVGGITAMLVVFVGTPQTTTTIAPATADAATTITTNTSTITSTTTTIITTPGNAPVSFIKTDCSREFSFDQYKNLLDLCRVQIEFILIIEETDLITNVFFTLNITNICSYDGRTLAI